MAVPFLDLTRQYETIRPEIERAIAGVFQTQHFILGNNVTSLEKEAADYLGVPYAVAVASGTDAILLSLRALGLRWGEGVVTTSFTFFATAGAIHNSGGRAFFVDIDPGTFNLSPEALRRFLESECRRNDSGHVIHQKTGVRVRGVLPVHLYGMPADMEAIGRIAREYGLFVLEDACQAFGAQYKGKRAGAMSDAGTFSFFPTKNLGGAGDGGMIAVQDQPTAERLLRLRVHGGRERYYHDEVGFNSRLDEVQAAVLRVKLPKLDAWNKRRADVAARYAAGLAGVAEATPPSCPDDRTHIYHQYVIRAQKRDQLREYLQERGIGSMIYYPVPLHRQKCFTFLGYREGDLPETEKAAAEVLALPVFAELTEQEIEEVCSGIKAFYSEA
ncbi:MAG: DegT/DnrJ/EryC1/StrS family aminotransferase [Acidobacteriota bacterium]|jgi:dTDP-4-amino-4,6-dideoxygalactose transaminase